MYNKVTLQMVVELHDLIGANCVFNDPAKREAYGRDESGLSFDPELVVEPDNIEQIQQLMAWATRHRIPVTPRAAASNVTGGALAYAVESNNSNRQAQHDRRCSTGIDYL